MKNEIKIFNAYVKQYDIKDPMISMKYHHTLRTVDFAKEIANSLNLNDEDIYIASLCALLHDVGRFYQWTNYQTFIDLESTDHGDAGEKILKEELIDQFYLSDSVKEIVLAAVREHNKMSITSEDERVRMFIMITRDADKLDIINTFGLYNHDEEIIIKKELMDDLLSGKMTRNKFLKTDTDTILRYLSWINDYYFPYSYKYLKESHIMDNKIHLLELYGETKESKKIKEYVNKILEEKGD